MSEGLINELSSCPHPPGHCHLWSELWCLHLCQAEEPLAAGFKHSSWVTDPEPRQQEQIHSFLLGIPFHEGYFPIHGSSWRVLGTFIRAANAGGAVGAFVFIPTSIPAPVIPHQAPAAFPGISPQLGRAGNPARAANLLLGFVDPLLPLSCCSQAPGDTENRNVPSWHLQFCF